MAAACFPRLRRDKDIAAVSLHLRLVPLGAQLGDIKRRRSGVLSSSIDNRRLGPMLGPWEMTKRRPLCRPSSERLRGRVQPCGNYGTMVICTKLGEGGKEPPFDRLRIIYRSPLRGTRFSRPPPSQRNSFSCSGGYRIVPVATGTLGCFGMNDGSVKNSNEGFKSRKWGRSGRIKRPFPRPPVALDSINRRPS